MVKTADERALPKEATHITRADAWEVALQHKGLAHSLLNKYLRTLVEEGSDFYGFTYSDLYDELTSVAYEGLLRAVENYDAKKGFTFSTYATPIVLNRLKMETRALLGQRGVTEKQHPQVESFDRINDWAEFSPVHDGMEDGIIERTDAADAIARVRNALDASEFRILQLRAEGLSFRRIGQILGLSKDGAKLAFARVQEKGRLAITG